MPSNDEVWYNRIHEAPALFVPAGGMDNLLGRSSCPVYHTSAALIAALTSPSRTIIGTRAPWMDTEPSAKFVGLPMSAPVVCDGKPSDPHFPNTRSAQCATLSSLPQHTTGTKARATDCTQNARRVVLFNGAICSCVTLIMLVLWADQLISAGMKRDANTIANGGGEMRRMFVRSIVCIVGSIKRSIGCSSDLGIGCIPNTRCVGLPFVGSVLHLRKPITLLRSGANCARVLGMSVYDVAQPTI